MKKSVLYIVFIALVVFVLPKVMVGQGEIEFLTKSEQVTLDAELQRISDKYDFHVVIETIDRPDGLVSRTAQALYESRYGSEDGVMLLIATESRDWDIGAHGRGLQIFHAPARERIGECILSDLSSGDLYDAYCLFAELCEDYLQQAETGTPYGQDNLPPKPLPDYFVLIALGVGAVIAYFVVQSMKKQLESVAPKASAADYVRSGSLQLHSSQDVFLYRNVTSHRKSNGGGGRSGGSRSSGGHTSGKF